jgi:isoleucyl-tRNA synthetase
MPNFNFPKNEEDILAFWQKNKIFEKSLEKKSPKGDFVFYDGPPFATGLPHYGHIVASVMKDAVPRYKTMRGYRVPRRWGWDCHGLPIENLVEKELRLKGKEAIEKLGIAKFNETCHSKVLKYAEEWKKFIPRIGRWVNMKEDYRTMNPEFMESVWWVFKTIYDKGLIYEGYKSMHICPRCETSLSNFEVTQNYKDIKDLSLTAKFKIKNPKKIPLNPPFIKGGANDPSLLKREDGRDLFILAWTTTPWTLPGNVALAVGEKIQYAIFTIEDKKDVYIVAKDRLETVIGDKFYNILETVPGSELVGSEYEPLFDDFKNADLPNRENLYKVVAADFVTTADGTGVVHIAPAFGEDDLNLGKEKNLSFIQHVDASGKITADLPKFVGQSVKPIDDVQATDKKIVEYLRDKELVFSSEECLHSYPHCWRCETPLINYAASSWFVKVSAIRGEMIKNNQKICWVPEHIKDGRFGKWLEGAKDWAISRNRYWGTPLPVWRCEKIASCELRVASCEKIRVIGSIAELEKLSGQKVADLHSQFVDNIEITCECGGKMKWIGEVLDCWFESGSMPYAQFATREKTKLPADFIAEGVDQTRGWFYTLLALATALFNKPPFKNVIVNGIVLTEDGQKMSKSKKNFPDPNDVIAKYGADALRFYLLSSPVMHADDLRFSEKNLKETFQKVLMILWNVYSFYELFSVDIQNTKYKIQNTHILDRWIESRLNLLISEVIAAMEKYDLNEAVRPIGEFINDLSTWYLRRSRDRFKSSSSAKASEDRDDEKDKTAALKTLGYVLLELSKILAPFTPFIAEILYKKLGGEKESVHLEDWPETKEINKKLLEEMELVRKIASLGLEARAASALPVRQPLGKLTVKGAELTEKFLNLLRDELNVKMIGCAAGETLEVFLDTEITPELKLEGAKRELVRHINALRKEAGLTIADRIVLHFETADADLQEIFDRFGEKLLRDVLAEKIIAGHIATENERELTLDGAKIWIGF